MDTSWRMIGFIPVRDAEAARRFYEGLLGMRFVDEDPFAVVMEANGIMIRLVRMGAEFRPVPYTILGWEVPDIEAAAAGACDERSRTRALSVRRGRERYLDGAGRQPNCLVQGPGRQYVVDLAAHVTVEVT